MSFIDSNSHPVALTIAGTDPSGGAGIQADLKTFMALGAFGTSAITAVVAQNTMGVKSIHPIPHEMVYEQIQCVAEDLEIRAVKTGMLHDSQLIQTVSQAIDDFNLSQHLVVDPVMVAKGGAPLLLEEAQESLRKFLIPLAHLVTPNLPEAEVLTGIRIENAQQRQKAAKATLEMGAQAVVIKGGHRYSASQNAEDYYLDRSGKSFTLTSPRIETRHTHGTGCTYSAALASLLAHGYDLDQAMVYAKAYIHAAISDSLGIGHGNGPTNHWAFLVNPEGYLERVKRHDFEH